MWRESPSVNPPRLIKICFHDDCAPSWWLHRWVFVRVCDRITVFRAKFRSRLSSRTTISTVLISMLSRRRKEVTGWECCCLLLDFPWWYSTFELSGPSVLRNMSWDCCAGQDSELLSCVSSKSLSSFTFSSSSFHTRRILFHFMSTLIYIYIYIYSTVPLDASQMIL